MAFDIHQPVFDRDGMPGKKAEQYLDLQMGNLPLILIRLLPFFLLKEVSNNFQTLIFSVLWLYTLMRYLAGPL